MTVKDEMMLVRMPPELKELFQALCKSRGVSVSSEVRRFIADEISGVATGMTTEDNPPKANVRRKTVTVESSRSSSRCNDTADLFDDKPKKLSHERVALPARNSVVTPQTAVKNATVDKIELPSVYNSAMTATNRRKKPKTRKK